MNNIYNVRHISSNTHFPVGATSHSKAIFTFLYEAGDKSDFIFYRARLARDYNGKKMSCQQTGILDIEALFANGYKAWWQCPECDADGSKEQCFDIVYGNQYKCRKCGHINLIPYSEE